MPSKSARRKIRGDEELVARTESEVPGVSSIYGTLPGLELDLG